MHSPDGASPGHELKRRFWQQIATGMTNEKAAQAVGTSQAAGAPRAVGSRWLHYGGGTPLFMSKPVSGRYLSFAERAEIGLLSAGGLGVREFTRRLARRRSTVPRELTRYAARRSGSLEFRASVAQWKAKRFAKRSTPAKHYSAAASLCAGALGGKTPRYSWS